MRQAQEVERAGFDALNVSDHFQPWWEPGESGHAWVTLGAIGQATERIPLGTGVTAPVFRHNPAVTAQAFMTLEQLYPGRAFLGIGSGESLNESPCGMDWPPVGEQVERMEEALEIIGRLFDGERLDYEGRHFRTKQAYLHTRAERRPPIYVSAFGPRAAGVAARLGDGLWTLADPEQAPQRDRRLSRRLRRRRQASRARSSCRPASPGRRTTTTALEGARVWKATQPPEFFTDDWHDPDGDVRARRAARSPTRSSREAYIVSADPEVHADRIREIERMGATIVCLQNGSGADPHRGAARSTASRCCLRCAARAWAELGSSAMGTITGERSVEIDAPIERCFQIAADVEGAIEWQGSLRDVEVLERDGDRRAALVETKSDAKVKTVSAAAALQLRGAHRDPLGPGEGRHQVAHGLLDVRGPRRRPHPRHLRARGRPRPHARHADPRPGRGPGARLPARRRGRGLKQHAERG